MLYNLPGEEGEEAVIMEEEEAATIQLPTLYRIYRDAIQEMDM